MKPEILQSIFNFFVLGGAVIAAIGGFGSQYYGKKVADAEKQKNDSTQTELKQDLKDLLEGNETLKNRLIPFEELASKIHPTLKTDAALEKLQEDYKRLEAIASKYEFTELEETIKINTIKKLKPIASLFNKKGYLVQITYETWTNAATQKYAAQLASILKQSGFNVAGPKQITYYIVQQSAPLEWGTSPGMINDAGLLFEALRPIFESTEKWTKREFDKTNKTLRLHFGGSAIFKSNGIVKIE